MRYIAIIVLVIWPFHHKKADTPVLPMPTVPIEAPQYIYDNCAEIDTGIWLFYGPDGAVGYGVSCVDAAHQWLYVEPAGKPFNRT